jgi:3' terminal RNA ribose 2'-O-methyltransferase Hen1
MLLTLTSTSPPATDLGFLLHKNPASVRSVAMNWGTAHVFYPVAEPDRCTAALLCEVDPVALVRRSRGGPFPLAAYVNDRPYAASSLLAVAIRKVFGTALRGGCAERPDLPAARLQLSAHLPVLPCRGGEGLLRRVLEPLGYTVSATALPLDTAFPAWGAGPYFDVRISAACRVRDLLGQLYVLLPVLDDDKHYWVSKDEIGKLVAGAGQWLAGHPERDLIVRRYLRHQPGLVAEATARLLDEDCGGAEVRAAERDGEAEPGPVAAGPATAEPAAPEPAAAGPAATHLRLPDLRVAAVLRELKAAGARRVLDLGCGDGRLLAALLGDPQFEEIVGVDASAAALDRAARRLRTDEMAPRQKERIRLLLGALTYADRRLHGYDAAVLAEVVEHVDPGRLGALEQAVFGAAAPPVVLVTTPNAEYNPRYPGLAPGALRHPDHRFEWTRAQFRAWAQAVAGRYGYVVRFEPVGDEDPGLGPPTQLAVLARGSTVPSGDTPGPDGPEPPGATMSPERQAARPHRAELAR